MHPTDRKQVEQIDATINRLRDEDTDFLTPETLVNYTGCTLEQAKERIALAFTHLARPLAGAVPTRSRPVGTACGAEHRHGLATTHSRVLATCPNCREEPTDAH